MKILIIDDEPTLASVLCQQLHQAGIQDCGSASSAAEGLDLLKADSAINLVVSDVVMAEIDGFTFRDSLAESFPHVKFIFISEYDLSDYAERIGNTPLLMKPVDPQLLIATIGEVAGIFPGAGSVPERPTVTSAVPRAVSATPRATPRATPASTPTPTPRAVPTAVVTGTPRAVLVATPVATPRAVPSPAPIAAPRVVAVAAPMVVPRAAPMVVPRAVPMAVPRAVPVASPAAKPQAAPSAVPRAVPVLPPAPAVALVAAAVRQATPVAAAAPSLASSDLPPDEFVGRVFGDYRIDARIGENHNGSIYRAMQTNVNRTVRFYTLSPDNAGDSARLESFVGNARVKANVMHPAMLAVYAANQMDGLSFYACEYVDGTSMDQIAASGQKIPALTALKIVEMVSDVMAYFAREKVKHNVLRSSAILLDAKGNPRLANIAVESPDSESTTSEEMAGIAAILLPVLAPSPLTPGVMALLRGLTEPNASIQSWPVLAQQARALIPKTAPTDAYKLDARERAAIQSLEAAKKQQKKMLILSSSVSLGLLAVILLATFFVLSGGSGEKSFDTMIQIPAGPFVYQQGETVTLPGFWIDEYEVTIAQYAKFLEWAKENPEGAAKLAHPEMPKGKTFEPVDWMDQDLATGPMLGYYARARGWRKYKGAALDVNSPVFGLDWYDAYAYAAWKGRRLPTEQEWEKAARGGEGQTFPWGNENNPKQVNSGADVNPNPDLGGEIDGYARWSPVDKMSKDVSPFGVYGMGGNVSEWTSTYAESEELFGDKVPVIRGGNWANPDVDTRRRLLKLMALQQDISLGFRTASDTAPAQP